MFVKNPKHPPKNKHLSTLFTLSNKTYQTIQQPPTNHTSIDNLSTQLNYQQQYQQWSQIRSKIKSITINHTHKHTSIKSLPSTINRRYHTQNKSPSHDNNQQQYHSIYNPNKQIITTNTSNIKSVNLHPHIKPFTTLKINNKFNNYTKYSHSNILSYRKYNLFKKYINGNQNKNNTILSVNDCKSNCSSFKKMDKQKLTENQRIPQKQLHQQLNLSQDIYQKLKSRLQNPHHPPPKLLHFSSLPNAAAQYFNHSLQKTISKYNSNSLPYININDMIPMSEISYQDTLARKIIKIKTIISNQTLHNIQISIINNKLLLFTLKTTPLNSIQQHNSDKQHNDNNSINKLYLGPHHIQKYLSLCNLSNKNHITDNNNHHLYQQLANILSQYLIITQHGLKLNKKQLNKKYKKPHHKSKSHNIFSPLKNPPKLQPFDYKLNLSNFILNQLQNNNSSTYKQNKIKKSFSSQKKYHLNIDELSSNSFQAISQEAYQSSKNSNIHQHTFSIMEQNIVTQSFNKKQQISKFNQNQQFSKFFIQIQKKSMKSNSSS